MIKKELYIYFFTLIFVSCESNPSISNCVEDYCGVCDNDSDNDCTQDCAGIEGGDAVLDECGICNGPGILDGECDCEGNVFDLCGVCAGDDTSCEDCAEVPNKKTQ